MPVQFHYQTKALFGNKTALKASLQKLFSREKTKLETLDIVFCSDAYLLAINKTFLQHNYTTDIITFDLSETPRSPKKGEIYISVDTVRQNAKFYQTSFKNELHRVIFHGALHLCGYKDKKPSDSALMKLKENEYLQRYFG